MESDAPHRSTSDYLKRVKKYHEQTKHDFNQYARSLGYMDLANQPDPFRRLERALLTQLKYHDSIANTVTDLGQLEDSSRVFTNFQKYLFQPLAVA